MIPWEFRLENLSEDEIHRTHLRLKDLLSRSEGIYSIELTVDPCFSRIQLALNLGGAPSELITSVAAQPSNPVPPVGRSLCVEPVLEGRASNYDDAIRYGAEVDFDPCNI